MIGKHLSLACLLTALTFIQDYIFYAGMPDNIRRSSKGTFLVAMSSPPARWFEIVVRSPMLRQIFTGSVPYSWIFKYAVCNLACFTSYNMRRICS